MKTYEQIKLEVAGAAEYVRSIPKTPAGDETPQASQEEKEKEKDFLKLTAHYPDHTVLEGYGKEILDRRPDTVRASTLDELELVYEALSEVHNNMPIAPANRDAEKLHEWAHLRAAQYASFREVWHNITILNSEPGHCSWWPSLGHAHPLREVTKLAMASILAAPVTLSMMDRERLHWMGYAGPVDVGVRILESDPKQDLWLPPALFSPIAASFR